MQNIREKIAEMKNQKQSFFARIKEKEIRLRKHRLIQNGALAEKYLHCENISPLEFEERLKGIAEILNVIDKK